MKIIRILPVIGFWLCLFFLRPAFAQLPDSTGSSNAPDAKVLIVENPGAMVDLVPNANVVQSMVDHAITNFTSTASVAAAWRSLVSTNDVVGIKVFCEPGPNSGTRVEVVASVVQGLLAAGLPPTNIVVWDRRAVELRIAGFYELQRRFGIRVQGSVEAGYDEKIFYERPLLGTLIYSDYEFGQEGPGIGRKSYMSKLVTRQLTKIINITPLLHHNVVGVTGNLYSLSMGSVDNTARFENSAEDLARAVPEICALPLKREDDRLSDHIVLNIVDALICQYEGQERSLLHYSTVLNQLRFSRDPVALDVLSLQEIEEQRADAGVPVSTNRTELYYNASLLEIGISNPQHIKVEKLP